MPERVFKTPGPDHPISIETSRDHVVVTVAGRRIADSRDVLILREASYPAVYYIPRKDVDMSLLQRTDHSTWCPYKGDCSYFSIGIGGDKAVNSVWTYEHPQDAVGEIRDFLAFYPDRVESFTVEPAR